MADQSEVVVAVLSAINAELPTWIRATEPPRTAPAGLPAEFVHVTVALRAGGVPRSGRRSTRGWAVYVTGGSASLAKNVRESLKAASDALENKVLVVGDERSTPGELRPSRPVGPNASHYLGTDLYHFAI